MIDNKNFVARKIDKNFIRKIINVLAFRMFELEVKHSRNFEAMVGLKVFDVK